MDGAGVAVGVSTDMDMDDGESEDEDDDEPGTLPIAVRMLAAFEPGPGLESGLDWDCDEGLGDEEGEVGGRDSEAAAAAAAAAWRAWEALPLFERRERGERWMRKLMSRRRGKRRRQHDTSKVRHRAQRQGKANRGSSGKEPGKEKKDRDALLLEVVLTRAARFAAGERTFVIAFAGVDADVACEVPRGRERLVACLAHMVPFLLDGCTGAGNGRASGVGSDGLLLLLGGLLRLWLLLLVVHRGLLAVVEEGDGALEAAAEKHGWGTRKGSSSGSLLLYYILFFSADALFRKRALFPHN